MTPREVLAVHVVSEVETKSKLWNLIEKQMNSRITNAPLESPEEDEDAIMIKVRS